ncbi:hypothetical protein B0T11DRAFT_332498 [Plectosphaerella cucumerina]|uniref:Uncharacterized protein n=1 Tax=Plectosphaerella cucumerina TaxID=40658 RepID=A0A8K0T6P8_9PEZI|nr:hypothetical protein B0T11DRAFT_332498 [Plectosphaerella cucumerina]
MPLTGDSRGAGQSPTSRGILSGWLPGAPSEASRALRSRGSISLPAGQTPSKTPRSQSSQQTTPTNKTTAASPNGSRFGFISSSLSALTKGSGAQSPSRDTAGDEDDHLLNLNIEQALFPPASPGGSRDPFSPASYKNLEMAATSLISTYQTAYRRQQHELRELRMDRDAKDEELEETEMRTRHLKLQLEDLARQADEREQEMQALVLALEKERKLNRGMMSSGGLAPPPASDTATVVSEDLGAEEDQKHPQWRKSHNFEDTDEESESVGEAPSVFSRSRSPTFAAGAQSRLSVSGQPQPQQNQQQMTAFQKLVKGFTGDADTGASGASCRNCHGQDGQVAWDTVGVLRDENRSLKGRVAELERCVEGALDAVNGLRL